MVETYQNTVKQVSFTLHFLKPGELLEIKIDIIDIKLSTVCGNL